MHIVVLSISGKQSEKLGAIAAAAARQLSGMGHRVDVCTSSDARYPAADFVVVCSEPKGIGASIGDKAGEQLARAEYLSGKRSAALMLASGFFPGKALVKLMTAMENEGLVVTMGETVSTAGQAAALMREVPLSRN